MKNNDIFLETITNNIRFIESEIKNMSHQGNDNIFEKFIDFCDHRGYEYAWFDGLNPQEYLDIMEMDNEEVLKKYAAARD